MSTFSIGLSWQRTTPDFDVKTFSRDHVWRLAGGQTVQGSSAPDFSGTFDTKYIVGLATLDERMVIVTDIEMLMNSADMELIEQAVA